MLSNSLSMRVLESSSRRRALVCLCVFFFIALCPAASPGSPPAGGDGQTETPYAWSFQERRDPFFAAALSWFIPGMGQVYVGRPLEGAGYWLFDNVLFWGAIVTIAHLDIGLERDIGFRFAVRMRENLSPARVWTSVGIGVGWLAFRVYTVLAAAEKASTHNQQILIREMQRDGLALEVTPAMGGMSWSYAF